MDTVIKEKQRRTYTIPEIQDILDIGRTAAYSLANSGKFKVVRCGNHYRISRASFDAWLDGAEAEE